MVENDPDKLKGPSGLTLRQIHEQVQKSVTRDREAQKMRNQLAQTAGPFYAAENEVTRRASPVPVVRH